MTPRGRVASQSTSDAENSYARLAGAVAWPLAARAQQPAMPVIGYLSSRAPGDVPHYLVAFHRGLKETGFCGRPERRDRISLLLGERTHSRNRCQHQGLLRVTATSDHYRKPTMLFVRFRELVLSQILPLTLLVVRRQPELHRWSLGATKQLAACAPEAQSLSCVRRSPAPVCPQLVRADIYSAAKVVRRDFAY
jgi:hypothetical protein